MGAKLHFSAQMVRNSLKQYLYVIGGSTYDAICHRYCMKSMPDCIRNRKLIQHSRIAWSQKSSSKIFSLELNIFIFTQRNLFTILVCLCLSTHFMFKLNKKFNQNLRAIGKSIEYKSTLNKKIIFIFYDHQKKTFIRT